MVTVDSNGRVTIPEQIRDRLGLTRGSAVEVYEEDGKIVVEPEATPERILERMESLVEETTSHLGESALETDVDPIARNHREAIRRGAECE